MAAAPASTGVGSEYEPWRRRACPRAVPVANSGCSLTCQYLTRRGYREGRTSGSVKTLNLPCNGDSVEAVREKISVPWQVLSQKHIEMHSRRLGRKLSSMAPCDAMGRERERERERETGVGERAEQTGATGQHIEDQGSGLVGGASGGRERVVASPESIELPGALKASTPIRNMPALMHALTALHPLTMRACVDSSKACKGLRAACRRCGCRNRRM